MRLIRLFLVLSSSLAWAASMQYVPTLHTSSGGTWSVVQLKYFDTSSAGTGGSSCTVGGSTCTVNVTAVGANHVLVCGVWYANGAARTLNGCGGGETWIVCPSPTCATFDSTPQIGVDARYTLTAVGGETTLTCTINASASAGLACIVMELAYSGPSTSIDVVNNLDITTGCTSCTGVALTLTGTKDAIVTMGAPANNFTAISSPYSTNAQFYGGSVEAASINTSSGTAPTITQDSSGRAVLFAVAVKGN